MRLAALTTAVVLALWGGVAMSGARKTRAPPARLQQTGLYTDLHARAVSPRNLEYAPQYPLWTDGATKRRWVYLPKGKSIDGSRPDAWVFPVGTKFWKEFAFHGRPVETRYMERLADGSWLYASYAWAEDGSDAVLVSDKGQRGACAVRENAWHDIPSVSDCKACHQGQRAEVLGFSALQLSPDRDPQALHAEAVPAPGVNLDWLVRNGMLKRFPRALLDTPPRISAATATERAALGYLHGNCGHCHNDDGPMVGLEFALRHAMGDAPEAPERAIQTAVEQRIKARAPGQTKDAVLRIEPGRPETSVVYQRMASRHVALQMPPLGSVIVDEQAIALLSRWIAEGPSVVSAKESSGSAADTSQ